MKENRITAEELEACLQGEFRALAEMIAAAINTAQAGRIIADSEEPVRDAHAEFRQQAYQRALSLLRDKDLQEDFPPRNTHPQVRWHDEGRQKGSHTTINGRLEFCRTVFWNRRLGSRAPLDELLGIAEERYSPGVREMACRLSLNEAFPRPAIRCDGRRSCRSGVRRSGSWWNGRAGVPSARFDRGGSDRAGRPTTARIRRSSAAPMG